MLGIWEDISLPEAATFLTDEYDYVEVWESNVTSITEPMDTAERPEDEDG